jgi:antitoxin component YwqK of YwqJK toxin-antitoxin module
MNGQKEQEGTFADGQKEGEWNTWYESGKMKQYSTFHDGEVEVGSTQTWDENENEDEE